MGFLLGFVMRYLHFDAVWYIPDDEYWLFPTGYNSPLRNLRSALNLGSRWFVGVNTGPHGDLVCVRPTMRSDLADELLSPAASTLAGAVFESWWKLRRLEKRGELTRQREGVLPPWHPLLPGGPKLVKHRRLDRCGHEDCEVCKSDSKWVRADEV